MNRFRFAEAGFAPRFRRGMVLLSAVSMALLPVYLTRADQDGPAIPNMAGFPDPSGVLRTYSTNGAMNLNGMFFQNLGTNGRTCFTCHQASDGMSISAAHVQARFNASQGLDPIFRTNDGSNCDHGIDVSTVAARSAAYSLLRTRGLIHITLGLPGTRDFEIVSVQNPYGCGGTDPVSMYRRPLPGTNLKFLSTVMWDGRESSTQTGTQPITSASYSQALPADLEHQALDATAGHAQGQVPLTAAQQDAIESFETSLSSAQAEDAGAGNLSSEGALGGPLALSQQPFYIGINDPVGLDPNNPTPFHFHTDVFHLFDAWAHEGNPHRQAVARGQALFNSRQFTISGVAGLNGATFSNGVTAPQSIVSTCGLCHDTPNVGGHSVSAPLNIGVADPPGGSNVLDTRYLPVLTICQKPALTSCVTTTDPGRAMISGQFADVGKFKGPILRGLAARAPYFHNGSAQTLMDVVNFYDTRFHIGFTAQEKEDLVAFLSAL